MTEPFKVFNEQKSTLSAIEVVEDKPYTPHKKCSCMVAAIIAMVIVLICNATGIVFILKFYFWEKFDKENEIVMVDDIFS